MPLSLLALALASFGIGTTEYIIMGLLPEMAADLHVSVPRAGLLVSGYAYAVAFGAPPVALAVARLPRKAALASLMGVFILGNVGCALAPSYGWLMAARVVTALAHGSFFGIGSVVARDLVRPERKAQAVAIMFSGLTLANVLGVPFGTALGQWAGWRFPFFVVVAIGLAAALFLALAVPGHLAGSRSRLAAEFGALREPRVLLPMALSALSSVSLFAVLTFVTPILEQVAGLSPHAVTYALLLFGLGITLGNLGGGRLGDRHLVGTVAGALVGVALVLALFALTSHARGPACATLFAWGFAAFTLSSPLQVWVVEAAADAPNLAATLNQGAFNFGNATGAFLGGAALDAGLGYAGLPFIGAAVAVLALLLLVAGRGLARGILAPEAREIPSAAG